MDKKILTKEEADALHTKIEKERQRRISARYSEFKVPLRMKGEPKDAYRRRVQVIRTRFERDVIQQVNRELMRELSGARGELLKYIGVSRTRRVKGRMRRGKKS